MLVDPRQNKSEALTILYEADATSGYATAFNIESYRTLTMEQFKEEVVPTLKSSEAEGKFSYYVLRDLSQNRYITLYPDGAVEYKVSNVNEIPTDKLIEFIQRERDDEDRYLTAQIINSPFPVYSYVEKGNIWQITVKTPETRFRYKHPQLLGSDDPPYIYMPPLLFTVKYSGQVYKGSSVFVLKEDSVDPARIVKARLPFPNIFADGSICMGNTHVLVAPEKELSKAQLLLQSWDLWLNGEHNNDLLNNAVYPRNLNEVYESIYGEESPWARQLRTLIEVLKVQGKWEELEWSII